MSPSSSPVLELSSIGAGTGADAVAVAVEEAEELAWAWDAAGSCSLDCAEGCSCSLGEASAVAEVPLACDIAEDSLGRAESSSSLDCAEPEGLAEEETAFG